jgi:uncharacterized membrane protein YgaE (UPF0421/DUF939 family)
MSTVVQATDTPEEHVHTHPSDLQYVKIAAILAVVTGLEVSTYFWKTLFGSNPSTMALVVTLFPMMIFKFFMVTGCSAGSSSVGWCWPSSSTASP